MRREERATLEIIAPSVDEAVAQGLADLNLPAEAVDVEVLDNGSRGLLGLGGRQARIRLTIKGDPRTLETRPAASIIDETEEESLLDITKSVVADILEKMGIEADITVRYGEEDDQGQRPVHVDLLGEDLAVLIGRRAETLNALQYIVSLIVGKRLEKWTHVILDVEGYRLRRENQLRHMARRIAEQAVRTGRRQVLEPMSAADRRIIHLELQDNHDVSTESIGENPARKVTIIPH